MIVFQVKVTKTTTSLRTIVSLHNHVLLLVFVIEVHYFVKNLRSIYTSSILLTIVGLIQSFSSYEFELGQF